MTNVPLACAIWLDNAPFKVTNAPCEITNAPFEVTPARFEELCDYFWCETRLV